MKTPLEIAQEFNTKIKRKLKDDDLQELAAIIKYYNEEHYDVGFNACITAIGVLEKLKAQP
jgi:hypothetical protein